jgi:hypothetical protein
MLKLNMLLFFLIASHSTFAQNLVDKGYRLLDTSVIKNYTLLRVSPVEEVLVKHIIKTNYQIDKKDAQEIAQHIINASKCFQIDPWVLTAVIQKESSFKKDAVSPTGAAGLTQFTTLGLKEVNDQLGFRGTKEASSDSIAYFTFRMKDCIDASWTDLWVKAGIPETDPEFYNVIKEEIKKDIPVAIAYGSILLKTYMAFIDNKNLKSETPISMSETYFQALQIYNGEEGDAKVKYAKAVFKNLKSLYPNELDFPFLQD